MPGYIQKVLQKYKHPEPPKPQNAPYPIPRQKLGKAAQEMDPVNEYPKVTKEEVLRIQQVVGRILYHSQAAGLTALMSLSTIASKEAAATKTTIKNAKQFLDYLTTHPNATMRFYASDMIMNIHSDAYYLSAKGASNSPQRSILLPLCHPEVCCIVRSRGRIRRFVPEHEGRENIMTYFKLAWPYATTNANSLRQHNHSGHCH